MVCFTGCRRTSVLVSLADSTEIKEIEEMQKRGSEMRDNSNFEGAIAVHDSCITMAEAIHDTIQLVIALNNQGTNYRRLSANKEASDCHFRALQLCDEYSDTTTFQAKKNRVRSLNGLGNIMMSLGNNDAAEKTFRQALHGEEQLGSATGQAINLANIGSIKKHIGERDSARIYYNRSMEMNRKADNAIGISLCYTYLGELDKDAGHITDAQNNYRQAYAVGSTTGDVWHWLTPCLSLAQIYVDQNMADSASHYINIGLEAAKKIHSNEHLRDLYAIRSQLEQHKGNVSQSLGDLQLCMQYGDSVLSEEERNSVQNARVNYESNRRTIEVKQAEDSATTSRLIRDMVIAAAILIVASMLLAFWFYRRSIRIRHKSEREREVFVRNVTHQLRTPMTVVTGMVEQLKDHIPAGDTVGLQNLEATKRQSRKLQELIMELARMSKSSMAPLLNEHGDLSVKVPEGSKVPGSKVSEVPGSKVSEVPGSKVPGSKASEVPDVINQSDNTSATSTILLAEDTDDVAMMMCGLLREHGYSVTRAADGQEALDMLQQELPDLLITDIAMPRMDGLQLMRHVRGDDTMCHLPIIVASARVEDSERMEGISAGAEVYLTKPFIPEELLLRVKMMLEQRARLRRSFSHSETDTVPADEKIEEPQMDKTEQSFIETLNKCIDDNMMSGDVNINFIADNMCASASTITRKIKNITGMPAATYIRTRRIINAKRLLTTTDKSITEIEVICGFNTAGHFSRLFKSETGMSPSEYRQKQK